MRSDHHAGRALQSVVAALEQATNTELMRGDGTMHTAPGWGCWRGNALCVPEGATE